jgi:hypothetical protein
MVSLSSALIWTSRHIRKVSEVIRFSPQPGRRSLRRPYSHPAMEPCCIKASTRIEFGCTGGKLFDCATGQSFLSQQWADVILVSIIPEGVLDVKVRSWREGR